MTSSVMDYSLKLRVASVFILFCASLLGVAIPLFFAAGSGPRTNESHLKMSESEAFRITRTFAAGIMLGVGFIHLLNDGVSRLAAVSLYYPSLGFTLATVGAMIVLGFEQIAVMLINGVNVNGVREKSLIDEDKNVEANISSPSLELNVIEVHDYQIPGSCDHNHAIKMIAGTDSLNVIVKAYMMEISVAIHSIIIGIALGSLGGEAQLPALEALIVAICFHQFFEGLGLGTVIEGARLHLGMTKITIFALIFALTVPVGVMIGIVITSDQPVSTGDDQISPQLNITQEYTLGCLNSIAAGNIDSYSC